jgi:hypothetical protein
MDTYRSLGAFRNEQIVRSQIIPNGTIHAAYFFTWDWETE